MRLRSFIASTVPEAMKLVRDELGLDAVVLSTQQDNATGKVRITAALEDTPLDELEHPDNGEGLRSIDDLSERLHYHRIPVGLTDRLLGAAGRLSIGNSLSALAGALDAVFAFGSPLERTFDRPVMLIGPPGAGKTATAAKLATRARLNDTKCRMITMDTVKAGGLAQIATFATALDAQLDQATDGEALERLVSEAAGEDCFTIIDTVGCNPLDGSERHALRETAARVGASLLLVLPAGGDVLETAETAIAFSEAGTDYLIGTKLDTTRRFGSLLSAAYAGGLTLVAGGVSPSIADGLVPLNPMSLARLLLPRDEKPAESTVAVATGTLP
jgi:flagellar biosynthesis protein FlhF